jgi:hypothetical protein
MPAEEGSATGACALIGAARKASVRVATRRTGAGGVPLPLFSWSRVRRRPAASGRRNPVRGGSERIRRQICRTGKPVVVLWCCCQNELSNPSWRFTQHACPRQSSCPTASSRDSSITLTEARHTKTRRDTQPRLPSSVGTYGKFPGGRKSTRQIRAININPMGHIARPAGVGPCSVLFGETEND